MIHLDIHPDEFSAYQAMIEAVEAVSISDDQSPHELVAVLLEIYGNHDAVKAAITQYANLLQSMMAHSADG